MLCFSSYKIALMKKRFPIFFQISGNPLFRACSGDKAKFFAVNAVNDDIYVNAVNDDI